MGEQLALAFSAPEPAEPEPEPDWITRFELPIEGAESYIALIRGPDDPERSSREERQARYGGADGNALAWRRELRASSPEGWAEAIVAHLGDGRARTFNAIMVELADMTADVAYQGAAHRGLALALADGRLRCTTRAPIRFAVSAP